MGETTAPSPVTRVKTPNGPSAVCTVLLHFDFPQNVRVLAVKCSITTEVCGALNCKTPTQFSESENLSAPPFVFHFKAQTDWNLSIRGKLNVKLS